MCSSHVPKVLLASAMAILVGACTKSEQISVVSDPSLHITANFPIEVNAGRSVHRVGYKLLSVTTPPSVHMDFEFSADPLREACLGSQVVDPRLQLEIVSSVGDFPYLTVPMKTSADTLMASITNQAKLAGLCPLHVGNLSRPALASVKWKCDGAAGQKKRSLAGLLCSQELPILSDPRGSIDRPFSGTCDVVAHNSSSNTDLRVELFSALDSSGIPMSSTNAKCLKKAPGQPPSWTWTLSPPPAVTLVSVPALGTPGSPPMVPPYNPDGIGPAAPSSGFAPNPTYANGQYRFNAPVDGCYVVKYTSTGGCSYYSPIVAESSTVVITNLDLHVEDGSPPSCPTPNPTCP